VLLKKTQQIQFSNLAQEGEREEEEEEKNKKKRRRRRRRREEKKKKEEGTQLVPTESLEVFLREDFCLMF